MSEQHRTATIDRVTSIVCQLFARNGLDHVIGPEDDLGAAGLTSTDMVSLMLIIEDEFAIKIPERELTPANFRSVANIDALVCALREPALSPA